MLKIKYFLGIIVIIFLPLFIKCQNFSGNAPKLNWMQINTKKVKVIFPKELDSQANRIANIVNLLDTATSYSIGGNQKKWNIVLQNQTIIPNAYVRMAPKMSEFFMTPSQDNFAEGSIRWDDNLIIHEDRHIQQFSNFNKGVGKLFSIFFGQEGQLLADGILVPDYFFEGDAVWQETLVSLQGRGRLPNFFNGYKSLWLANKNYSWLKKRGGSFKDFVPDHYPLGYIMVAYGYQKYGDLFWKNVTSDALHLKGLFNKAIERNAGVSFKTYSTNAMNYFKTNFIDINKINTPLQFITTVQKNNVIDYLAPVFIGEDSIIAIKKSYKKIAAFYLIKNNKEEKIKIRSNVIDDYFNYANGKIVYASYQSDPRWGNRNYSVINIIDIKTKTQNQISFKTKYFSPDININSSEILAVHIKPNGRNNLIRLNAFNGKVIAETENTFNYFFTQPKYLNKTNAISAVRNINGQMALIKIDLLTGFIKNLTPFTYNVLGYPFIKNDTVYFSMMNNNADKIFAITLSNNKIFKLTDNINGIYNPSVNNSTLLFTACTNMGYRLATQNILQTNWQIFNVETSILNNSLTALNNKASNVISTLSNLKLPVTKYKTVPHLFNFHSWRPFGKDPEFGYSLYSDNVLSTFSSNISYTYNRNDKSNSLGFNAIYGGWYPLINIGFEESFNRSIDTAFGKFVKYNGATLKSGINIPLSFIGGLTNKFLNIGTTFNAEQYYYKGVSKNIFTNKSINYFNSFISFSNVSQMALQHINPRWAQSISFNYTNAINFTKSHKFVSNASMYFPGFFINHSIVLNIALQKKDTLADLFSNNFLYARGYQALSTRQMYKLGANYHIPLLYPDCGFGKLIYFKRIRANLFYDYNNSLVRINNNLTNLISRSVGSEMYFDTKVWLSLPVTFGIRYSHLLDTDLLNPTVKNKWEIIMPINLIPN